MNETCPYCGVLVGIEMHRAIGSISDAAGWSHAVACPYPRLLGLLTRVEALERRLDDLVREGVEESPDPQSEPGT